MTLPIDKFKRADGQILAGRIYDNMINKTFEVTDENIPQLIELTKNAFVDDKNYDDQVGSKIFLLTKLINKTSDDKLKKQALSTVHQICNEAKNDTQLATIVNSLSSMMSEASKLKHLGQNFADDYLSLLQACLAKDIRGPETNKEIMGMANIMDGKSLPSNDIVTMTKLEALKTAWMVECLQTEQGEQYVSLALSDCSNSPEVLHYIASKYPDKLQATLAENNHFHGPSKKVYEKHPEFFSKPFDLSSHSQFTVEYFTNTKTGSLPDKKTIAFSDPIKSFNKTLPPRHLKKVSVGLARSDGPPIVTTGFYDTLIETEEEAKKRLIDELEKTLDLKEEQKEKQETEVSEFDNQKQPDNFNGRQDFYTETKKYFQNWPQAKMEKWHIDIKEQAQEKNKLNITIYKSEQDKLKDNFAAKITYNSPNNIALQGKDGKIPDLCYFNKIVQNAKQQGAETINFGNIKTTEFKAKLLIACLANDMNIKNPPSKEELETLRGTELYKNIVMLRTKQLREIANSKDDKGNYQKLPSEQNAERQQIQKLRGCAKEVHKLIGGDKQKINSLSQEQQNTYQAYQLFRAKRQGK